MITVPITNDGIIQMPRKNHKHPKQESRGKQVILPEAFHAPIEAIAEQEAMTFTEAVKMLLREGLAARAMWPPKATSPQDGV